MPDELTATQKAFAKARASEAASKEVSRIARGNADVLELRLVQLKGGKAGISGPEFGRLKRAVKTVEIGWLAAAPDGTELHAIYDRPLDSAAAPTAVGAVTPETARRSEAAKRAWVTIRANRAKPKS